jgi:transcriptional regulator with XRE-family HTH domain
MNANRLRWCVNELNWSLRQLSRVLQVNFTTVQRWASGKQEIASDVELWLETLAQCHANNPPPVRHEHERTDDAAE